MAPRPPRQKATRTRVAVKSVSGVGTSKGSRSVGLVKEAKSLKQLQIDADQAQEDRKELLKGLSEQSRLAINDVAFSVGAPVDDDIPMAVDDMSDGEDLGYEGDDDSDGDDDDDDTYIPDISHEGGEFLDAMEAFTEDFLPSRPGARKARRSATISRRDRINAIQNDWEMQLTDLTHAYLTWRHGDRKVDTAPDLQEGQRIFHVRAISTHHLDRRFPVPQNKDEYGNVSLVRVGFLGSSPRDPSVAFSLDTLELYHRLKRRHPRLGVQAMMRTLCDLQNVTYLSCYRDQLSAAFDVYLMILRAVRKLVNTALGRDTPDYRIHHSCPACSYELEQEAPLYPTRLLAMDGNNSAKRLLSAGKADNREFHSDYFLSREQVDIFKNEAKSAKKTVAQEKDPTSHDLNDAPFVPEERNPEDVFELNGRPAPCADSWKASAAETQRKAKAIYDITGIFPAACRHGVILKACEMVQSGELRKYSLSILDHLMRTLGEGLGVGFDIGCSLQTTIENSPLLGPLAKSHKLLVLVNAFHGWAHSRSCQIHNHPLYKKGVGIEDLETMERLFSSTNDSARCIRLASYFHWKQALDLHFQQWDEDKYCELGRFLFNNYRQALQIIDQYSPIVDELKESLHIQDADIDYWLVEEQNLYTTLKEAPAEELMEIEYVQAIIAKDTAEETWRKMNTAFVNEPSLVGDRQAREAAMKSVRQLVPKRRSASERYDASVKNLEVIELKLDISEPWDRQSENFKRVLENIRTSELRRAMDKVQYLVVQRLLEFDKAHATGMSYQMRSKISQSMKKREDGISSATKHYNDLASVMDPAPPLLDKDTVFDYTFLAEFDLLRHAYSRADVTSKPWSVPSNRQVALKYFKIQRAREEINRVNIEVRRLQTWIRDDNEFIKKRVASLRKTDPLLAMEVELFRLERFRMNYSNKLWINHIHKLDGFTGNREPGKRATPKDLTAQPAVIERDDNMDVDPSHAAQTTPPPTELDSDRAPSPVVDDETNEQAADEDLILAEISTVRREEDLVGDDDLAEQVAQVAEIMEEAVEMMPDAEPKKKRRNRLQDKVPALMMNRWRF